MVAKTHVAARAETNGAAVPRGVVYREGGRARAFATKVADLTGSPARVYDDLVDIDSHRINQLLFFTGSDDAAITMARPGDFANADHPYLPDFGQLAACGDSGRGWFRVDWYTPAAPPAWGDGRLTLIGANGYIERRKHVDVGGREGGDRLILVNRYCGETIDAPGAGLPFFARLAAQIRDRIEGAMRQSHAFWVDQLALKAQTTAEAQTA